jgi:hypothetical protein
MCRWRYLLVNYLEPICVFKYRAFLLSTQQDYQLRLNEAGQSAMRAGRRIVNIQHLLRQRIEKEKIKEILELRLSDILLTRVEYVYKITINYFIK